MNHNHRMALWLAASFVGFLVALWVTAVTSNAWVLIAFAYGSWTASQVEQYSCAADEAL